MTFQWETRREKLKQWMKIPAKKKMEWLQQMHEFTVKASSKRQKKLRQKLREMF